MPKTVSATYLVSAIDPTHATHTRGYELKLVEGFCPFTKAAANINAHDPKADFQHPYNRIESLVQKAVEIAEDKGKHVHITLKIAQDAPMWLDDVVYTIKSKCSNVKDLLVVDGACKKLKGNSFNGKHIVVVQNA